MTKLALLVSFILSFAFAHAATYSAPEAIHFQGQIIDTSTNLPLSAASVTFTLDVMSPGAEACVLYEETQTLNMSTSNGVFDLALGQGTRTGSDPGLTLDQVFSNTTTLTGLTCASGSSYTPASGDPRKLKVSFNDGSGNVTLGSEYTMESVPYALYANSLQGETPANFVQVNTSTADVSQSSVESIFSSSANVTALQALINGTSTLYTTPGGTDNFTGSVSFSSPPTSSTAPTSGTQVANKNYCDGNVGGKAADTTTLSALGAGQAGEVLEWNGTQWTATTATSTDNTKLPLAGGTMSGAINMNGNNITNTGYITQNAGSYVELGTFTNTTENTLITSTLTPGGASYAGVTWYNSNSNTIKYWNGSAAVAVATLNSPWTTSGSNIYYNSGNVGIGTTTPGAALDLASGAMGTQISNDGTTGTTVDKLAKLSSGKAIITATTDTSGILGIVTGGAGTTGSATIAKSGQASCVFDGATTAGDYVQASSTTAGDCHDAGASPPSSGQIIGRVLSTNGSAGTYGVLVYGSEIDAATSGGSGTVTSVGLSLPTIFSVTGSPVTTSGTLSASLASQAQNLVFASPSGSSGTPSFRALTSTDIPNLDWSKITTGKPTTLSGYGITDAVQNAGSTPSIESGADTSKPAAGTAGRLYVATDTQKIYTDTGSAWTEVGSANGTGGTVTSVGLSAPSIFSVTGSPVTSSGTLTESLASEAQNSVFAGPSSGGAGTPSFRALTSSDLPAGGYDSTYFKNGGNSFGAAATLGTADNYNLSLETNGSAHMTIDTSGNVGIGTTTPGASLDLASGAVGTQITNDGTTGTTVDTLAKLSSGKAVTIATTDTSGILGVVTGGAGTTGSATIATSGQASCVFDGATTAGDYVQASSTTAGDCHDAGATLPSSGQIIGQVLSTNASSGTYAVLVDGGNTIGTVSSPWSTSGTDVYYNSGNVGIGTATPSGTLDVEGGTAAASTNGANITLRAQNAGTGNQNGANVMLIPGAASGTGTFGSVVVQSSSSSPASGTYNLDENITNATAGGSSTATTAAEENANATSVLADSPSATIIGSQSLSYDWGSHLIGTEIGVKGESFNSSTGAVTAATGVMGIAGDSGNSGSITSGYGGNFSVLTGAGSITTGYGVYIGNIQSTNKFSLYASDATAPSYFAGNVGIGTTTPGASLDLASGAVGTQITNDGTTGTTVDTLAKLSSGKAVTIATTDTSGILGVVTGGAGTTGSATIATSGQASCVFDGATTAGDYVQASSTTAGDCHDVGATLPTSGQIIGRVLSTNAAGGTFSVLVNQTENVGSSGTNGTVTSVGLSLPSIFSVTGSPVTTSGTLTASLASEAQNLVLASPSGSSGTPSFRALTSTDIPNLDWSKITTGTPTTLSGYGITDAVRNLGGTIGIQTGLDASKPTATAANTGDLYVATDTKKIYTDMGSAWTEVGSANGTGGTVTSVGLSAPSIFSVTGSPVTSSGTLTESLASEAQNSVFAGPSSGGAGTPSFRALTSSDLPTGGYDSTYFKNGGNSFGAAATLGTADNNNLSLETNGSTHMTIDTSGNVGIGTTTPGAALDLASGAVGTQITNDGTTGTTVDKLAKLSSGKAVLTATTDTSGILGVVTGGAGTTGSATIATSGQASCVFDGATTAGDYVQASSSTAGDCHDAGASLPTSGQIIGQVLSTNAAGGTYALLVSGGEGQTSQWAQGSGFIYNSGNVAIGQSTLDSGVNFEVTGNTQFNNGNVFNSGTGITEFEMGSAGTDDGTIQNDSSDQWSLGYSTSNSTTLGTPVLSWNSSGEVGIGTTPTHTLDAQNYSSETAAGGYPAFDFTQTVDPASATSGTFTGASYYGNYTPAVDSTSGTINAASYFAQDLSSASGTTLYAANALTAQTSNFYGGDLSQATAINANVQIYSTSSGGTIDSAYGLNSSISNYGTGSSITNGYGVYVGSVDATNKYSVYASDSTAPSYFAGDVGVGGATPSSSYPMNVTGDINSSTALRVGGTQVCTASGCTSSSDRRLKKDIRPLQNSLNNILKLKGVSYKWKDPNKYGHGEQIGLIAQDLQKVYPQVVVTDKKTGYLSVAYGKLIGPVIEAIKDLNSQIKSVEARVEKLFKGYEGLKTEIAKLKGENRTLQSETAKANKEARVAELQAQKAERQSNEIKSYLCAKNPHAPFCGK